MRYISQASSPASFCRHSGLFNLKTAVTHAKPQRSQRKTVSYRNTSFTRLVIWHLYTKMLFLLRGVVAPLRELLFLGSNTQARY
jgi:hypothetical protein